MARKRQRFSRLKAALKLAGGGAAAGSALANFKDFQEGRRKIEIQNKVPADKRGRRGVAILPFNIAAPANPGAGDRYRTTITIYSNEGRGTLSLSNAELGYDALEAGNQSTEDFYAARLIVFVPTSGESTPTSAVTGKEYKRKNGKSYTIPFGRATDSAASAEETRRIVLAGKAKTGGTSKATSVSYEPEYFGNARQDIISIAP